MWLWMAFHKDCKLKVDTSRLKMGGQGTGVIDTPFEDLKDKLVKDHSRENTSLWFLTGDIDLWTCNHYHGRPFDYYFSSWVS